MLKWRISRDILCFRILPICDFDTQVALSTTCKQMRECFIEAMDKDLHSFIPSIPFENAPFVQYVCERRIINVNLLSQSYSIIKQWVHLYPLIDYQSINEYYRFYASLCLYCYEKNIRSAAEFKESSFTLTDLRNGAEYVKTDIELICRQMRVTEATALVSYIGCDGDIVYAITDLHY